MPSWLRRAVRNRHRHAIEQVSRRWRGGRRGDSARTRRKILISTQVREGLRYFRCHRHFVRLQQSPSKRAGKMVGPRVPRVFGEPGRRLRRGAHAPRAFTIVLPLALFAEGDLHPGVVFFSCDRVIFIFYICRAAVDHNRVL